MNGVGLSASTSLSSVWASDTDMPSLTSARPPRALAGVIRLKVPISSSLAPAAPVRDVLHHLDDLGAGRDSGGGAAPWACDAPGVGELEPTRAAASTNDIVACRIRRAESEDTTGGARAPGPRSWVMARRAPPRAPGRSRPATRAVGQRSLPAASGCRSAAEPQPEHETCHAHLHSRAEHSTGSVTKVF